MAKRYHGRMQRAMFTDRFELSLFARSLESKGFVRAKSKKGPLRVMTYRMGLGKGRSSRASRENGPWWLYWQEPLRLRGSKAAERKAAA